AEDRTIKRTGTFFDKMIRDKKIIYTAAAPSGDFDNDGRIDLFLTSWWLESPAMLLKNETPAGHWLDVKVQGSEQARVNRDGIGALVLIYAAGKSGDAKSLLGCVEIAAGYGYSSGQAPIAHFGLGAMEAVDLVVRLPHTGREILKPGVKANQRLTLSVE
ncbi:MAG TPA: ASPIC/UnbV domain-containing protein, partial [Pirellulaceae bacterium]|nr:ASPIC/UnbV domain-containing protein [Pirellulaceae bacterium]